MEDKSSEKPSLVICQEHKDEKGENFCWKRESLKKGSWKRLPAESQ